MKKITTTTRAGARPVTVVGPVNTEEDRQALRADVEFHDGTIALLTYLSRSYAFFGEEPPRVYAIVDGAYVMKGEAGDFQLLIDAELAGLIVDLEGGVEL